MGGREGEREHGCGMPKEFRTGSKGGTERGKEGGKGEDFMGVHFLYPGAKI